MRRIIFTLLLAATITLHALPVWAACTTQTINIGGRLIICTTCCYFGNCTTNCT